MPIKTGLEPFAFGLEICSFANLLKTICPVKKIKLEYVETHGERLSLI